MNKKSITSFLQSYVFSSNPQTSMSLCVVDSWDDIIKESMFKRQISKFFINSKSINSKINGN